MTQIAIQQYRWADVSTRRDADAPERPLKKHDHLVNAAEYLATHFMTGKPIKDDPEPPTFQQEIINQIRDLQKKVEELRGEEDRGTLA